MDILRVTTADLFSYESLDLDLENRGLVLLEGMNGSGKSSIFRSITWTLYNDPLSKRLADEVIREDARHNRVIGNTFGKVELLVDGRKITVTRHRQHHEFKNKLLLHIDGNEVTASSDKETQGRLNELLGMTAEVFKSSVLFPQKGTGFAERTDAQQKDILDELLSTERFVAAQKKVKAELDDLRCSVENLSAEKDRLSFRVKDSRSRVDMYETKAIEFSAFHATQIRNAQRKIAELESNPPAINDSLYQSVQQLEKAISDNSAAKELADKADSILKNLTVTKTNLLTNLRIQEHQLSQYPTDSPVASEFPSSKYAEEVRVTENELYTLKAEITVGEKNVVNIQKRINQKEKTTHCDKCGQSLTDEAKTRLFGSEEDNLEIETNALDSKKKRLAALEILRDSSKRSYEQAILWERWEESHDVRKEIETTKAEIGRIEAQIGEYQRIATESHQIACVASEAQVALYGLRQQITQQEAQYAAYKRSLDNARSELAIIENQTCPYTPLLDTERENLKHLTERLRWATRLHTVLDEERKHYEWVEFAFGNKGVKNYVFDRATPFLNSRINDYLSDLSNGAATATFRTIDTLADGTRKEKFNVEVKYVGGGSKYTSLSGGEENRVNVAAMFALGDLGAARARNPVHLRLLDEIFDGLDALGKELVVQVIREKLVPRAKTILVMSHDETLKQLFENRITVVKENGVSRIIQ